MGESHINFLLGKHAEVALWSYVGCIIWGFLFPLYIFFIIAHNKSKLLHEEWWKVARSTRDVGVRGVPEQDIPSLDAMGWGAAAAVAVAVVARG